MDIVKSFKERQKRSIEILDRLDCFLMDGEKLGVHMDAGLRKKIAKVMSEVENQRLRVALIGGFSEGKTSIAAAWLEKYDEASMKIDYRESSDEVVVYSIENDLELIDTPGLFGFKEKMSIDAQTEEKYKDITRKYISEAHLLLYVMNAQNPIKESHKTELEWLLRELNLLDRTVFVLSKFDGIADMEDNEDFEEMFQIKKQNIEERLCGIINLTPQEKNELSIVAVSANPFGRGVDYWLEHRETFKKISHIEDLQKATLKKIQQSGGSVQIIEEAKSSVIQDVINRVLPNAIQENEQIQKKVDEQCDRLKKIKAELDGLTKRIDSTQCELREFVLTYFNSLTRKLNGTSLETFREFVDTYVGKDGIVIRTEIQNEFQKKIGRIVEDIEQIECKFEENLKVFNESILKMGKQGIDFLRKSGVVNSQNILSVRDGIVNVAKFVGTDLSELLKFKPWVATKLASSVNVALGAISLCLEIFDHGIKMKAERDFANAIEGMQNAFDDQREGLLEKINSSDFVSNFSGYSELASKIAEMEQVIDEAKKRQIAFNDWTKMGEVIDVDFAEIKKLQ